MPRVSITIPGKNPQPYRFKLDRENVDIGRSGDNAIVIDCPSVSSHHCTMERVDGGFILRDNNSTNGIKLHGDKMEIIDLKDGLDVFVGDVEFEYTLTDEENEALDSEDFARHERKKLPPARSNDSSDDSPRRSEKPHPQAAHHEPNLASSDKSTGFFTGLAALLLALLAFAAGLNASYNSSEKKKGRTEISLLKDIRDGRPPAPAKSEE